MKKIITIIGPTAIGKTNLSIELAKLINGQIVGLDSRQIYKGMSIGTAQPTELEMGLVKHHLIGFREPWESISAGEYSGMVIEITKNITKSGFSPIISGGAGLYYRALTSGIFDESTSNMDIRLEIENEYDLNSQGSVLSPMVGTIYMSSAPGEPPFVQIGDSIKKGQTILVVEAMKTFNEIVAPISGKLSKLLVTDSQPVEFGELLAIIE